MVIQAIWCIAVQLKLLTIYSPQIKTIQLSNLVPNTVIFRWSMSYSLVRENFTGIEVFAGKNCHSDTGGNHKFISLMGSQLTVVLSRFISWEQSLFQAISIYNNSFTCF